MSTPPPPPPSTSMTMAMLLPVEKVVAIRESEDRLNARSHHRQTINLFPAWMLVYHYASVFDSSILVIIIVVVISVLNRRILCACVYFAYVQCSPLMNNKNFWLVGLSLCLSLSLSPDSTNNLIYMVLTTEYSAFAVQLFSCCVIRYLCACKHWTRCSSMHAYSFFALCLINQTAHSIASKLTKFTKDLRCWRHGMNSVRPCVSEYFSKRTYYKQANELQHKECQALGLNKNFISLKMENWNTLNYGCWKH